MSCPRQLPELGRSSWQPRLRGEREIISLSLPPPFLRLSPSLPPSLSHPPSLPLSLALPPSLPLSPGLPPSLATASRPPPPPSLSRSPSLASYRVPPSPPPSLSPSLPPLLGRCPPPLRLFAWPWLLETNSIVGSEEVARALLRDQQTEKESGNWKHFKFHY